VSGCWVEQLKFGIQSANGQNVAECNSLRDGVCAGAHAEARTGVADVVVDGAARQTESHGNLCGCQTPADELETFYLSRGKEPIGSHRESNTKAGATGPGRTV
jgi:hypothetical protein